MVKNIIIVILVLLGIGYVVADKPIIHTVETKGKTGHTSRVTVNVLVGVGNTINYNHKDEL